MATESIGRVSAFLFIALVGLFSVSAAAETRGKFGDDSCRANSQERIDVPAGAAYAIYYDKDGVDLGAPAEILKGTSKKRMCAAPLKSPDDAGCVSPKCPKKISGTWYCDVSFCTP